MFSPTYFTIKLQIFSFLFLFFVLDILKFLVLQYDVLKVYRVIDINY